MPVYNPGSGYVVGSRGVSSSATHPILNLNRPHKGQDYRAARGTVIPVAFDGVVIFNGIKNGFGNVVVVEHLINGVVVQTLYAHMQSKPDLSKGTVVKAGDTIGKVGSSGLSSGPHLHFEIKENPSKPGEYDHDAPPQDPLRYSFPTDSFPGSEWLPPEIPDGDFAIPEPKYGDPFAEPQINGMDTHFYWVRDSNGYEHRASFFGTKQQFDKFYAAFSSDMIRDNSLENIQNWVDVAKNPNDLDFDNIPNDVDDDIDGDGIKNIEDSQPQGLDMDNDGIPDLVDNDVDGDEISNLEDYEPNGPDYDRDGVPDVMDADDDGDSIPDDVDANNDAKDFDLDGVPDYSDADIDGDGIPNSIDSDPTKFDPRIPKPKPPKLPPPPPRDPLALDLNGDGVVNTLPMARGIHFDLDNSGFAEQTSWVAPADGLLVLDRNNNNFIDGGAELFGTETLLNNGKYAAHGFEALAEFDLNQDGAVDANDAVYSSLRVWRDANSNGIADSGELKTLSELDIKSIATAYTNIDTLDANNVNHREAGTFTYNNSTQGITNTLWFESDRRITVPVTELQGNAPISDAIKKLPNAIGFGNTYSLHQAMAIDASGDLQKKVQKFSVELNPEKRQQLLREILVLWTGTGGVVAGSRGNQVDATSLSIMESFWGQPALQNEPFGAYASSVNEAYIQLEQSVYSQLMASTHMRDLLSLTDFTEVNGVWTADYSVVVDIFTNDFLAGNEFSALVMAEYVVTIRGLDVYSDSLYNSLITEIETAANLLPAQERSEMLAAIHSHDEIIVGSSNADLLEGFGGDDRINGGYGNDILEGGDGDDRIYGDAGDDIIRGGTGMDYLQGGIGNDTYNYKFGDGGDIINETIGIDSIVFGENIDSLDIHVVHSAGDLIINVSDDGYIIVNGFSDHNGRIGDGAIDRISFIDNEEWNIGEIILRSLKGSEFNDQLYGYSLNDTIDASVGDDVIYGLLGNDNLTGGKGIDTIHGGDGDDSYLYQLGDGNDEITDTSGIDEIVLGEGISPDEITLARQGWYGLKIVLKDGGTILINKMFNSSDDTGINAIESIRFSNDDVWDLTQIKAKIIQDSITEGNDIVEGFSSNDVIESGGGFDQLRGKGGDDRYIFNRGDGVDIVADTGGNDTLVFGPGIDPTDMVVHKSNGNFYFIINNGEMVQVVGSLIDGTPDETKLIERVEFSNGAVWDKTTIQQKIAETLADANLLMGRNTWDHLRAGNSSSVINGLDGDDQIYGGNGNDTLIGGGGLNFLDGGSGDDTYLITEQPAINFIENFRDGFDRILFAEGIVPGDVSVRLIPGRQESHLQNGVLWVYSFSQANDWNFEIKIGDTVVYLDSLLTSGAVFGAKIKDPLLPLGEIEFFNGTQWTVNDLLQQAVKGTTTDDYITGSGSGDVINGLEGNDVIHALDGADVIDGGEGNDTLTGGYGKDVLIGGKGNDLLRGDNSSKEYSSLYESIDDVYRFNRGDGNDTVEEYFGRDIIEFGPGITKEQVVLSTVGDDTVVSFLDSTDTITIKSGALPEPEFYAGGKIEVFKFANGDELNFDPRNTSVLKEGGDEDDTLTGGSGNDTFIGHSGNDDLRGDLGDDSYYYNLGDGFDNITDVGGFDQIIFGISITPDMVKVRNTWNQALIISVNGVDALSFNSNVSQTNPDFWLEKIAFSSVNEVWDQATIFSKALQSTSENDEIYGSLNSELVDGGAGNDIIETNEGNDTLVGGIGNDYLRGGAGDDVYRFGLGDGSDSLSDESGQDTIEFLEGILPGDISVQRTETDLILKVKNANPITLSEFFNADSNRAVNELSAIENIIFANGETWTRAQLLAKLSNAGTSSANSLYGLDAPGLIDAKEGNDSLFAGGGNDTVIGGSGNDTLHGEAGDDLLQGGDGADWLYDAYGSNIYEGGKGNDFISLSYPAIEQFAEQSTIRFGLGDGIDEIYSPTSSPVTIELGVGITPDMLAFKSYFVDKSGGSWNPADENRVDLLILGASDRINKLLNNGVAYTFKFSDNTFWTADQLNDATKKSMAMLSENRRSLTGNARSNSRIYISYLNQNNTITEYPVIQTDASGNYEFDFGFGVKDVSRIIISSKDSNGNTLPITAFGPAIDTSIPPSPTVALDSSGYVITGYARPGTYVSASTPDRYIGNGVQSDLITGAFTIVSSTRLNNGENISVVASSGGLKPSEPTVVVAPYMTSVPDVLAPVAPRGNFNNVGKIVSGTAEPDTLVFVQKYTFGNSNHPVVGYTRADQNGYWSIELAESIIDGGVVNITSVDAGNNRSYVSVTSPDLTAPLPATALFDNTGKIITGDAEWTASGGNQVIIMDATNTTVLGSAILGSYSSSYRITLATALKNNEVVNIIVKDVAGNSSTPTKIYAPDKTPPAVPTASFDTVGKIVTGIAEAGSTVVVKNSSGVELKTAVAHETSGAFSITLDTALINKETVNVTAKDAAGNISNVKAVIAPDKTPPAPPTASINTARKIITGVAEAGSVVEVKNTSGSTLGSITANVTTGAYSITLTTALTINQTVNITAKDAAGNISPIKPLVAKGVAKMMFTPAALTTDVDAYNTIVAYAAETNRLSDSGNISNAALAGVKDDFGLTVMPRISDKYISGGTGINALIQAMASFEPTAGLDVRNRTVSVDQHQVVLTVGS